MRQIEPFNPQDPLIQANVEHIMKHAPVKNLTREEVLITLRLIQLEVQLRDEHGYVSVFYNDRRLEKCDDTDKFLAMLLDRNSIEYLLGTRFCMDHFGGTRYHWQKIGRTSPITTTASAVSDCSNGYYGRGWIIAPHIMTLRNWIIMNSDNEEISKLKGRI